MLEDEESRDIYLNKLNWLISWNEKYLEAILTQYVPAARLCSKIEIVDIKDFAPLPQNRKIVLYGAGQVGRALLSHFQNDERFIGFCSHTKEKQKKGYFGWPVISPEELLARKDMSVVISTYRAYEEIKKISEKGGYPQEQIFDYKRGLCSFPGQYFEPDFMTYEDEEVLIDAGCYDLYTTMQMRKYCKNIKKVYAFEPDPENFALCQQKKAQFHLDEVELLPFGTWSERTTLHFDARSDTDSRVCDFGEITVPVTTIDETIAERNPKEKVTFIKMDIEGSELEALKGAKEVIQRDKPKLAICIYHKPEDMTEIPLYIKELVPEYRLFIRHYSNWETETVLYAILPK